MPSSSTSPVTCDRGGDTGWSPVFAGSMKVMTVLAEPSFGPGPLSLTTDDPPTDSPVLIAFSEGRDVRVFKTGPVVSLLSGTLYEDVVGELGSVVNDLRSGMGFGEMTGGGVGDAEPVCCQRSSTELCLLPGDSPLSGVDGPSGVTSRDALFSTTFFTKPRPCNLLRLGVGSFAGGGLRNAGEGLCDGGD